VFLRGGRKGGGRIGILRGTTAGVAVRRGKSSWVAKFHIFGRIEALQHEMLRCNIGVVADEDLGRKRRVLGFHTRRQCTTAAGRASKLPMHSVMETLNDRSVGPFDPEAPVGNVTLQVLP
jgi:hypothetical protein